MLGSQSGQFSGETADLCDISGHRVPLMLQLLQLSLDGRHLGALLGYPSGFGPHTAEDSRQILMLTAQLGKFPLKPADFRPEFLLLADTHALDHSLQALHFCLQIALAAGRLRMLPVDPRCRTMPSGLHGRHRHGLRRLCMPGPLIAIPPAD